MAPDTLDKESDEHRRRVLRTRAEELARVPETSPHGGELFVVSFDVGPQRYAVEARFLQETIPVRKITRLPLTPDFILGIVNLRGRVLAVTDLKRVFKLPDAPSVEASSSTESPSTSPDWDATSSEGEAAGSFGQAVRRSSEGLLKIVVISFEGRETAVLVDRVRGASALPLHSLKKTAADDPLSEFVHGTTPDDLIVIDAQKLLASPAIVVK